MNLCNLCSKMALLWCSITKNPTSLTKKMTKSSFIYSQQWTSILKMKSGVTKWSRTTKPQSKFCKRSNSSASQKNLKKIIKFSLTPILLEKLSFNSTDNTLHLLTIWGGREETKSEFVDRFIISWWCVLSYNDA